MQGLDIQKFRRFAPNETRSHNFGHFCCRNIGKKYAYFWKGGGEEISVFGQNIYLYCVSIRSVVAGLSVWVSAIVYLRLSEIGLST